MTAAWSQGLVLVGVFVNLWLMLANGAEQSSQQAPPAEREMSEIPGLPRDQKAILDRAMEGLSPPCQAEMKDIYAGVNYISDECDAELRQVVTALAMSGVKDEPGFEAPKFKHEMDESSEYKTMRAGVDIKGQSGLPDLSKSKAAEKPNVAGGAQAAEEIAGEDPTKYVLAVIAVAFVAIGMKVYNISQELKKLPQKPKKKISKRKAMKQKQKEQKANQ